MRSGRKAVPAPLMAPSRYSSYKPGYKSTKTEEELICSGRISNFFFSTSGTLWTQTVEYDLNTISSSKKQFQILHSLKENQIPQKI